MHNLKSNFYLTKSYVNKNNIINFKDSIIANPV